MNTGTPTPGGPPSGPIFQPVQSLPEQPSRPPWLLAAIALVAVGVAGVVLGALLFGGGRGAQPSPSLIADGSPATSPSGERSPAATSSQRSPASSAAPSVGQSPAASPGTSPGGSPAPTADGSPGGPAGTIPPDIARQIEDVIAQVPPIRELEEMRDVPYQFISREQFQADLEALLEEEQDPEFLAAEERLLKRLGLLPDDVDLEALLLELYGAGVAAYYQPEDGTFYIIERDAEFGPLDRMYVAHEYNHALQDQHFDLEGTRITDPSQGDAVMAQLAAVEGDATWLMVLWAQQNLSFEEVLQLLQESLEPAGQEVLEGMPQILARQLGFPYTEGMVFVNAIQGADGWEQVNEMLQTPPASTEQILHPEKYRAGEQPIPVQVDDVSSELGDGWSSVYEQTFGELNTQVWVGGGEEPPEMLPGAPVEYPFAEVAAGWGGDRLRMYEGPDDAWAVVWRIAWDSQEDVNEFEARALELESTLDGVMQLETIDDSDGRSVSDIRMIVASDTETLELVNEALGL